MTTTFLIALLVISWAIHVISYGVLTHRIEQRDYFLDYLFRYFNLQSDNPYMPSIGENIKRCIFCQHPEQTDHSTRCPWLHVRPFVKTVYSAVKKGL